MTVGEYPLRSNVAMVTGASSGIGHGVAEALADAGAAVVVNYRSHGEEAAELVGRITARGGKAHAVKADVSGEE